MVHRLLLVDDDEAMRYSVARDLKRAGYEVAEAGSGEEALERMGRQPDLVLLDVRLPDISGFEVCRRIKANPRTNRTPVLQISAERITAQDQVIGLEGGADAYLTHPIDKSVLLATVHALLRIHETERELARQKERLSATLSGIGDAVFTLDEAGCVQLMNRVAEEMTGILLDQARGKDFAAIAMLRRLEGMPSARYELTSARTEKRMVEKTATRMRGDDPGTVVVLRDITEKLRYEDAVIKTQKLESLGVLAGGIAHDFNNLLAGILGNVSLARVPGVDAAPLLEDAEKACLRARGLTQQLLTFAKGGAPVKRVIELSGLIKEAAEFALRGTNVCVEFECIEPAPPANVDAGQLSQVIHNLVLNAAEAMPDGGTVRICVEPKPREAGQEARQVRIAVIDTGTGIQAKHLEKIFDPYFSTKQKGSGLGLAVVYSIVKKHEGEISVASEPGSGSRFDIILPASPTRTLPRTVSDPLPRGCGRVLVMDDEPTILRFMQHLLSGLGYDVSVAASGEVALQLAQEADALARPFDLAILDLTLPGGMGGRDVLAKLKASNPSVRAIAASGYSTDPIMCEPLVHGFVGVLPKPFRPAELAQTVASALSSK